MLIKDYVADVMEQLRDFVPDGGEVQFEVHLESWWADDQHTRTTLAVDLNKPQSRNLCFSVPMTGSRVKSLATPEEHQS